MVSVVPVGVGVTAGVAWDVPGGEAWGCPIRTAGAVGVGTAIGGEALAGG